MRMPRHVVSWMSAGLCRRVSTKASRFSLAVTCGFMIAAVGVASVSADRSGHADDLFSVFGTLFGAQPSYPQYQRATPRQRTAASVRVPHRKVASLHPTGDAPRAIKVAAAGRDQPVKLGRQSMCVRLCDGFTFPVGTFHGDGDKASHEATCRSECPGARTALYVMPSGASAIDDAIDVHSGKTYSEMPAAFHYTTYVDQACSCHPQGGNRLASLLRDFTLRRGDAVMTARGFKVFHGGARFPYRQTDFVMLSHSRDIQRTARATFHAIEKASLISMPTPVAQAIPAAPMPTAERAGTRGLQHRADLTP